MDPKVRIGLNFCGDQKAKVMASATSSNNTPRGGSGSFARRGGRAGQTNQGRGAEAAKLARGIASMSMDAKDPGSKADPQWHGKERVSGLDSFEDSSYASGGGDSEKVELMSMQERLRWANSLAQKGGEIVAPTREAMEVDRQKRSKVTDIQGGEEFVQGAGSPNVALGGGVMEGGTGGLALGRGRGGSAKRYKSSAMRQSNLTGGQHEPRQEQ